MSCCVVLSVAGRARLAAVLRALHVAQLLLSLGMLIFTYNVSVKVMLLLKNIHQVTVLTLYGLITLQAYAMKLQHTSGLRLLALLLKSPHWPRITTTSTTWMQAGAALSLNGLLVYAACRSTLKALSKDLSVSLYNGISQYLTEPFWKRLLDTMQTELTCCGADAPTDWHEVPWINLDVLNPDSDIVLKLAGVDGKVLPPVTPYSCCTPHVLTACYHDPLQQAEWVPLWRGSLRASLAPRGCMDAVRAPLTKALLGLHCCTMLSVLLQAVMLVLYQLVRTSARDAVLRGAAGAGRGALWSLLVDEHEAPRTHTKQTVSRAERGESSQHAVPLSRRRKRNRRQVRRSSYPCLS